MRSNTNPTTLRARELRQTPNPAEQKLWAALKGRQLGGHKFTRQFSIGPYFADFACRSACLLVELDGSQHLEPGFDDARDVFVLAEGYSLLRFPSRSVLQNCDSVCETILACLEGRLKPVIDSPDLKYRQSLVEPRKAMRRRLFVSKNPPRPRGRGGSRDSARRGGCLPQTRMPD